MASVFEAARCGDVNGVAAFLAPPSSGSSKTRDGDDVFTQQNENGWTILHVAASCNHLPVCRMLVERGFNIEMPDNFRSTPMRHAASNGHIDVVKYFLDCGCDVNSRDATGQTALHRAVGAVNVELIKLLLERGASTTIEDNQGKTPVFVARSKGKGSIVAMLVENGRRCSQKQQKDQREDGQQSPSSSPRLKQQQNQQQLIVASELKTTTTTTTTKSPKEQLFAACRTPAAGETNNNSKNNTVSATAAAVVSSTLDKHPSLVSSQEGSEDQSSVNNTSVSVVDKIVGGLTHSSDIDVSSSSRPSLDTPLHAASAANKEDIVKILIQRGAPVDFPNAAGMTAFRCAADNNNLGCCRILLSEGANVDHKDPATHQTALHRAVMCMNERLINILLENGASTDIFDKQSKTALTIARSKGNSRLVSMLSSRSSAAATASARRRRSSISPGRRAPSPSSSSSAATATASRPFDEKEAQIDLLERARSELQRELAGVRLESERLRNELEKTRDERGQLQIQVAATASHNVTLEEENVELKARVASLSSEVEELVRRM